MNDISSLVGSFWTASLTRVNTSVIAESSLFLDNCLLFVFIRTNSSFSLTLSSEISTDKSLGELEAEGSSAKSGWQDSLVFTTSKRVVNHLPNPWSSWNRLIPVADFCVRAACLHKKTHFFNLLRNWFTEKSKCSPLAEALALTSFKISP